MTQFTDEQLEATTKQAAAKLQAFYDGLSDDERHALEFAARRFLASEEAETQGYMINQDRQPKAPPYDRDMGRLVPYVIMGPTISNGRIVGNTTYPY